MSGISFTISKSFGQLGMIPSPDGLLLSYVPVVNKEVNDDAPGSIELLVPIEALGGLWSTAKAFLYAVESFDENIILQGDEGDILIKLYRDRPKGPGGSLTGEETSWLRIVSGKEESERRRIKLGARDLISIDLVCSVVQHMAVLKQMKG